MSLSTLPEEAGACGEAGGGGVSAERLWLPNCSTGVWEVRSQMSDSIQACCSSERRRAAVLWIRQLAE